jgi:hypothetical protein
VVYGMEPEGEKDQQQASQTDQHQACVSHKDSGEPKNVKLIGNKHKKIKLC